MKRFLLFLILTTLLLAACGSSPAKNLPAAAPPATAIPTTQPTEKSIAIFTASPSAAPTPTFTLPPPTETPDPCAGATSSGARQKFTYAEIVPCLDGPEKVYQFMLNNLAWDPGWDGSQYGGNAYSPASEVYANGTDDCDGLAEFGACVLSQHGWESYNLAISIIGPQGHNVTGFVGADGKYYAINMGQSRDDPSGGRTLDGPFKSWEELAQEYINRGYAAPNGVIWLFSPCITERILGDAVVNLPHKEIR